MQTPERKGTLSVSRGPEPRTLNLSQHPSLYYAGKHKELSEAIGKEQLTIKIEKKAIFKL